MKSHVRFLSFIGVLIFTSLACNLGVAPPAESDAPAGNAPQDIVLDPNTDINVAITYAVQTLQAQTQQAEFAALTATPTPGSSVPTVTVNTDTNCRTGPNINYEFVMLFKVGMSAEVIAVYPNYWVIKYPGGNGATCWLWGQYATVIGDTSQLPQGNPPPLPPTPTPEPTAPKKPNNLSTSCVFKNLSKFQGQFFIVKYEWTVTLQWKDRSDNETGFKIYRDGTEIGAAGENDESFVDVITYGLLIDPPSYTYGVRAYNNQGQSNIEEITISTCP